MLCFTFLLSVSTTRPPPISTLFPYTTLFRSALLPHGLRQQPVQAVALIGYEAVEGRRGVVAIAGHERSPVLLRCHRIGSGSRCVVSMPASESIQRASSRRWVEEVSSWARIWESRKDSGGSHSASTD